MPLFDVPTAKSHPTLIARDEQQFAVLAATLERTLAELTDRLDQERRAPARGGTAALERDQEVHRLTVRLATLRRFGLDLCLGRIVPADGGDPVYIGRLGLTDADGRRLLVDWRSPAAEPFFGATLAQPLGLATRRRYRWSDGRITDYWDEVFTGDHRESALDADSAFLAGLGDRRTGRMRDVLATIAADQDAIIRAASANALVVDGGPGTGKTVVALHRAAYLLYADPRLREGQGGVLFVGPHQPYLDYVADVLPGLGEDGVRTCTLRDLVPEGATAGEETDPEVARLKASARLGAAIEAAVALYEEPPTRAVRLDDRLVVGPREWADAFAAAEPGTPHNAAREQVWAELVAILADRDGVSPAETARNRSLAEALNRARPLLAAGDVVGDLWTVPAYLRRCAPWLTRDEITTLQREEPSAWTVADLPWLDAARRRLGDPGAARRAQQRAARARAAREEMDRVVAELVAADDSELLVMSMLRGDDLRNALDDESPDPVDPLAGPFAHVVVDEAQELTDAEWQLVLARCPSGSLTVVGDRAQARRRFGESWRERLDRVGARHVRLAELTINYRTPEEVMDAAAPVIRAVLPDANVPTSVRRSGVPVRYGRPDELDTVVADWLATHDDGVACVIGAPEFAAPARVSSLSPVLAKGLEFDLVVLVRPESFAAVDRYVAMTRATDLLVVLGDGSG